MRNYLILLALSILAAAAGCGGETKPSTPLDTFKQYTKAIKDKDVTTMKLLLSAETIKAHEQEAKAQGITVDEIVKRETLFSPDQRSVEYRNEKVEGEKGSLEVKDPYGRWETVLFILEAGQWKIDKKRSTDQLMQEIEELNRQADEQYNMGNSPSNLEPLPVSPITPLGQTSPSPFGSPTPSTFPSPSSP